MRSASAFDFRLENGPAANYFLAFRERAVGRRNRALGKPYSETVLAWQQAPGVDKRAVLTRFLYKPAHRLHKRRRGPASR